MVKYYVVDDNGSRVGIRKCGVDFALDLCSEPYVRKSTAELAIQYIKNSLDNGLQVTDEVKLPLSLLQVGGI